MTSRLFNGDVLQVSPERVLEGNLTYSLNDSRAEYIEVGGILVPSRGSTDFPDVTQNHYILGTFLKNGALIPRRSSTDFPDVTKGHEFLAEFAGEQSLEREPHVVDLGCGTGVIGTYLGKNLQLQNLVFSDLSKESIEHARRTVQLNHRYKKGFKTSNLEFRLGNAANTLNDLDGGVAFCAPYLIPEVCTVFPEAYNVFAGVSKAQGMKLYVAHSNLSQGLIEVASEVNDLITEEVFRAKDLVLNPEYGSGTIPEQRSQAALRELFPETIEKLKILGLKGEEGKYGHDIVVTRFG